MDKCFTRRSMLALAGATLAGLGGKAGAQTTGAQTLPVPAIDQVRPYLQVKTVRGDEHRVRAFFSPACPYSKMYFQFFRNLEASLPADKTFAFTPLINKGDGVGYALGFLAVEAYLPQFVDNFVEASLVGVQDRSISTLSWAGIDKIARAARIPVSLPQMVQAHAEEMHAALERALQVQSDLAVTNTPTVSVAGTYLVTPEFTAGDAAMFSRLVNGLISMAR
jgi:hypothetical protein